jgi:DNA-binding NtrC family response regulator
LASATLNGIVGHSAAMRALTDLILKAAPHDCPVLIQGESGTGKELVARAIHSASRRASGPFIAVNCGAIPEALIEAQLFGHQKGSFTGATSDKRGYFEEASSGTIFLDEIGEMPLSAQVKLLRVLQEKEVVRLGATKPSKVNMRVVAATNRDLTIRIAEGQFRADLYYRLNVVTISLPPLRERRQDIPLLAANFLQKLQGDHQNHQPIKIDQGALDLLASHDWPGNVRQLENAVQSLLVFAQGSTITAGDVARSLGGQSAQAVREEESRPAITARGQATEDDLLLPPDLWVCPGNETIRSWARRAEQALIKRAIDQSPNLGAAAARLGLSRRALKLRRQRYSRRAGNQQHRKINQESNQL